MPGRCRLLAALLCTLLSATAARAQESAPIEQGTLARLINRINGVTVRIGGDADRCGLTDPSRYVKKLEGSLARAGLVFDPAAITGAYLFVWVDNFGVSENTCAVFMSLRFGANVAATTLRLDTAVEQDRDLVTRFQETAGNFPAVFYIDWQLFVRPGRETPGQLETVVDALIGHFNHVRTL